MSFFFPTANQKEITRERIIVLPDALKIALLKSPGGICVADTLLLNL